MRTSFLISAENMPGNARGRPETPGDVRKRREMSGNARQEASAGSSFCGAVLTVDCLELGQLPTNTYLVMNTETKECLIIDPSDGVENIVSWLDNHQAKPVSIWLTHGHDDHMGSVSDLKRKYGLLCYVSKEEEEFCESIYYNLSTMFGHPRTIEPDLFFLDGQKVASAIIFRRKSCCFRGIRFLKSLWDGRIFREAARSH